MEFAGKTVVKAPLALAMQICLDPDGLRLLLPVPGTVRQTGEGRYDLELHPATALISTTLPGTLTITPMEPGHSFALKGEARTLLFGSVRIDGSFRFQPVPAGCAVSFHSRIDGSGLIGRVLPAREFQLRARLDHAMQEFRRRIERAQQAGHA